jgi:outer membrane immunogenic protein
MKKILISILLAVSASPIFAQSAFEGFYGQIGTGYESNSLGSGNGNASSSVDPQSYSPSSSSQQIGGAPLVLGIGYNFSVTPKWLIGIGADYSALSQTSSNFSTNFESPTADLTGVLSGHSIQLSNRLNVFITPGYAIDDDKLIYLKAGYSSISAKLNGPDTYTVSSSGVQVVQVPLSSGSSTTTVGGYVVGLGYKQIIAGGIYGFIEANYMSYSKPSFSTTSTISNGVSATSTLSTSLNSYQALVGIGYRF